MFGKRAAGKSVDKRVMRAARTMVEKLERRVMLNATARVPAWVEQGLAPLFESIGTPSLHTGAVEAIASMAPIPSAVSERLSQARTKRMAKRIRPPSGSGWPDLR